MNSVLVDYTADGYISLAAEAIKQSIPVVSHICSNKLTKDKLIKTSQNNIKFARESLLITLYCDASTIHWDEKKVRKEIIANNIKFLNKLKVGTIGKPCLLCSKKTTRLGKQYGTKRMLFCSTKCEDEYLNSTLCSIDGCKRVKFCRSMCKYHYAKWYSLQKSRDML